MEEHNRDQAEIKGEFSTSSCRFLLQERKEIYMNVFFVLVLQSQLNQTEAQCSSVEHELKGDCSLLPTMSQTFVSIVGI